MKQLLRWHFGLYNMVPSFLLHQRKTILIQRNIIEEIILIQRKIILEYFTQREIYDLTLGADYAKQHTKSKIMRYLLARQSWIIIIKTKQKFNSTM